MTMMHAGGPGGDPTGWGLMGNAFQPTAGLMQMPQFQQPQMTQGPWSQMAYQMAGRPNQGPYANVATPPMPDGASGGSTSGGGSALGGTALGLLGSLAQNPSALKNLGSLGSTALSKLGGLFGAPAAAAPAAGSIGAIMAGGSPTLATIGTGAVAPAADAAAASAASALGAPAAAAAPAASSAPAGGAAMGAGAGALAAAGIFAIPAILASTVAQHDRNASQYASMLKSLNSGPSDPGYNSSMMAVVADIANGETREYPAEILQKAQQLGLYNTASSLSAYKGPIGQSRTAASPNRQ